MNKLLYISHSGSLHGAEQVMLSSLRICVSCGCEVTVLIPKHAWQEGLADEIRHIGAHVVMMPYRSGGRGWLRTQIVRLYNLVSAVRLAVYCRRQKITKIYSNTSVTILGAQLAALTGLPHIWHIHEPIDSRYGWRDNQSPLYRHWMTAHKTQLIFISRQQMEQWSNQLEVELNGQVIYNPIRQLRDLSAKVNDVVCYGYVGSMDERKNIQTLIDAFNLLHAANPDTRLLLCGAKNEEERNRLQHGDGVEVRLHTDLVDEVYDQLDVFVLPSFSEMMPLTVLEAMYKGLCVIQTCHSGMSELCKDGQDCLIIDPTCDNLFHAMTRVLQSDLRSRLAANAANKMRSANMNRMYQQQIEHLLCE